ncbi:hypothetical protein OQA88_9023 [Cercophora sp. LCS_1]
MFAPSRASAFSRTLNSSQPLSATLPSFLVPALQSRPAPIRRFSATPSQPSKLGRTPISVPPGVEITIGEPVVKKDVTSYRQVAKRTVTVSGPLGELNYEIEPFVDVNYDNEARVLALGIQDSSLKKQKEMWGTTWSYLNRYVKGVSEGHTTVLRLVGIGYRATVEDRPGLEEYPGQKFVVLKLGFSHPVEMGLPKGVTASAPQPTRIMLEGIDKEVMHSFAAKIRQWRRPEPYKGKGIFVNDETIKLKQKKIK